MSAVGGSIEAVSLSGREFGVLADAESNRKLGGWENEVRALGNSDAILIKTRVPLSVDGLTLETDDTRGDHEFLQELANRKSFFAVGITYASGVTYQATAQIVGELQVSNQTSSASVSLSGPGVMTKQ